MADILRIKRRVSGSPGAPATLGNAEIAYNEVDHILYYGEGGTALAAGIVLGIGGPGLASSTTPIMDSVAAIGTGTTWARNDHVHPSDTSRAPTANPTFTGTVTVANLTATGVVSGVGFSNYVAAWGSSPTAIGNTAPNSGAFTTLSASGVVSGVGMTNFVTSFRQDQFQPPNTDVPWNNHKITGLLDPTNPQDAATKNYVDLAAQGIDAKQPVRMATTTNLAALSGLLTVDGITAVVGDRVLVKDQTTQSANGIYVAASGAWARALDADTWGELPGAFTFVELGTVNADNGFLCTSDPGGTLGTTAVTWVQFSGAGQIIAGGGLTKTGNQIDVIGTAGRIAVFADNIDIDATYVGQASIVTVGSVTTGTWNATTIAVNRGGTGAVTLSGYVFGNGTSAFTASATIPNTSISGLGTMSTQNATAVAITGGTIDGVTFDMGTF